MSEESEEKLEERLNNFDKVGAVINGFIVAGGLNACFVYFSMPPISPLVGAVGCGVGMGLSEAARGHPQNSVHLGLYGAFGGAFGVLVTNYFLHG